MNRRRKGGMMVRGIGRAVACPLCHAGAMTNIYPGHPFQHSPRAAELVTQSHYWDTADQALSEHSGARKVIDE